MSATELGFETDGGVVGSGEVSAQLQGDQPVDRTPHAVGDEFGLLRAEPSGLDTALGTVDDVGQCVAAVLTVLL